MGLRVLLADESSTIKRVIQLALQDFAVEVKSVPVGLDVVAVAKTFNPDIIFADVLLAKRSGYEVASDIKNESDLKKIPVVLMWSGFMELDESKVLASRVDGRLEKPFDPEQLRTLCKDLVPSLKANVISEYLTFPERPDFVEPEKPATEEVETEEFRHVPLPKNSREIHARDQEDWAQTDLQKFRVNTEATGQALEEISLSEVSPDVDDSVFSYTTDEEPAEEVTSTKRTGITKAAEDVASSTLVGDDRIPALDFERAEQILRQQAREVLEAIAWKILPDIAERVVREELHKLLKDSERLDQV